jgi:hypothetical protein
MKQVEITLVCEGHARGRDVRWLNLALSELAQTFEPATFVRVVPGGSKADLGAAVRGLREATRSLRVYAVRDRDFLRAHLLAKDEAHGVHSLERHCLESYLIEPRVVEAALGQADVETLLLALARRRFWPDLARAVLDDLGYAMRKPRPSLEGEMPVNKDDVVRIAIAKLDALRRELAVLPLDPAQLVEAFEVDMNVGPVWTRVNGKALMADLENDLGNEVLPGANIEGRLFKWCAENSPPGPFVADIKKLLETLLAK